MSTRPSHRCGVEAWSHSSANNSEAVALRDWLISFEDLLLDLDPERGLKAGERWQRVASSLCRNFGTTTRILDSLGCP